MKALTKQLWTAQDISSTNTVSGTITPQMLAGTKGTLVVEMDADPTTAVGLIVLEGRCDLSADFGDVQTLNIDTTFPTLTNFVSITPDVQLLKEMRIATRNESGAYSGMAGRTANAWVQEG